MDSDRDAMLDPSNARLVSLVIHRVGNKLRQEDVVLSERAMAINTSAHEVLLTYFLAATGKSELMRFVHPSDVSLNALYSISKKFFSNSDTFLRCSKDAANILYSISDHPRIKKGDISFVQISGLKFQGKEVSALGIFKSERTEPFLQTTQKRDSLAFDLLNGIPTKNPDKACIILNTEEANGYRILNYDTSDETRYWQDRFLGIDRPRDTALLTEVCIEACTSFVKTAFPDPVQSKDRITAIAKAFEHLEESDTFKLDSFTKKVFADPQLRDSFKKHKRTLDSKYGIDSSEAFVLQKDVIHKQRRKIKRTIRLDTSIEVTLGANAGAVSSGLVERGFDSEKKMHFYKLFFNREI